MNKHDAIIIINLALREEMVGPSSNSNALTTRSTQPQPGATTVTGAPVAAAPNPAAVGRPTTVAPSIPGAVPPPAVAKPGVGQQIMQAGQKYATQTKNFATQTGGAVKSAFQGGGVQNAAKTVMNAARANPVGAAAVGAGVVGAGLLAKKLLSRKNKQGK